MPSGTTKSKFNISDSFLSMFLLILFSSLMLIGSYHYSFNGQDFTQDWIAAKSFLEGKSIYGDDFAESLKKHLNRIDMVNYHPPTSIWLYLPFATIKHNYAALSFNIFNIIISALFLPALLREFYVKKDSSKVHLTIAVCSYPLLYNFFLFQNSLILALLVCYGIKFYVNNMNSKAAILWALAASLKIFPAFLFILLIIRKRFSDCFLGFSIFILTLLPVLIFGKIDDILHYISYVCSKNFSTYFNFPVNNSIWGLFSSISYKFYDLKQNANPSFGIKLSILLIQIIITIISLFLIRKMLRLNKLYEAAYFCLGIALIICPLFWQHYYLCFMPLNLYFLRKISDTKSQFSIKIICSLIILMGNFPDLEYFTYISRLQSQGSISAIYYLIGKTYFMSTALIIYLLFRHKIDAKYN